MTNTTPIDPEVIREALRINHEQAEYIDWTQPVEVLMSAAGYYIGMKDAEGFPAARFSCEYYPTRELAEAHLMYGTFNAKTWL